MAKHRIYDINNKFLSKLKFKSKTMKILKNIVLSLVIILLLNWIIAVTTNINFIGTGFKKLLEAVESYNKAIPRVEIASDDWESQTPGSWHIDKSAKWTGANTAEVVFDLKTIKKYSTEDIKFDVVMLIDVSTSMKGNKFERLKESAKKYFDEVLTDTENRVGIVEFHTYATVLENLTNNKETLNNTIDNLTLKCRGEIINGVEQDYGYCTNYYDSLKKTEDLLESYVPKDNRQLVVLLLTDGYANRNNQLIKVQYNALKNKYPEMVINGIQYEMGGEINYYLKQATDEQYYATSENIYNQFFTATYNANLLKFETFEIVDYIKDKYFQVNSSSDINVDIGTIKLENDSSGSQKIIWTLNDNLKSGKTARMTIKLTLKDKYVKDVDKDFYPTNTGEDIKWQFKDEKLQTKGSTLTPVLQRIYNVIYDNNPPSDCTIANNTIKKHYVSEHVKINDYLPTCAGYIFKGWEITSDNVQKINDTTFIMPEHDVTIRGKWSKLSISKSMKGQILDKPTLYEIVKLDAESNDNAGIYNKKVTDTFNVTQENTPIYYYKDYASKNNVVFAGFCWQIVRTTATGGVKLLYNGISDNGTCKNDRDFFASIYDSNAVLGVNSSDLYSDGYAYDKETKKLKLTGDMQPASAFEKHELIGKYTCRNQWGHHCDDIYEVSKIDDEANQTYAIQYALTHYAGIGKSTYNSDDKFVHVGYMYHDSKYELQYNSDLYNITAGIIFGSSVLYDGNKYILQDTTTTSGGFSDYKKIQQTHRYTCLTNEASCSTVLYFKDVYQYYELSGGKTYEDVTNEILYADDVNTINSSIKSMVDSWYETNLTKYTAYLEDVVYCNDRSEYNKNNTSSGYLYFGAYYRKSRNAATLECKNQTDQFSIANPKAQLIYPIGLLTLDELMLYGNDSGNSLGLGGDPSWWVNTPYATYGNTVYMFSGAFSGWAGNSGSFNPTYIARPAISLKPGIKYTTGVGTPEDPFIIETN